MDSCKLLISVAGNNKAFITNTFKEYFVSLLVIIIRIAVEYIRVADCSIRVAAITKCKQKGTILMIH